MLTIPGFLLISLILFGLFFLWYWAVHRNGVYNAARANDEDALAQMSGTDRLRPTASNRFATAEIGTIGEREDGLESGQRPITDPHRLLPAPAGRARTRRLVTPISDTEFAAMPTAEFEALPDQLPVLGDGAAASAQQRDGR